MPQGSVFGLVEFLENSTEVVRLQVLRSLCLCFKPTVVSKEAEGYL
jgi:hypothetical protein